MSGGAPLAAAAAAVLLSLQEAIFSRRLRQSCVRMGCGVVGERANALRLIEWKERVWNSVHTWQILLLRSMADWNFIYLFLLSNAHKRKSSCSRRQAFIGAKMCILLLMIEDRVPE